MAKVAIEAFDENKHPNPMRYIDNEQFFRYQHSGGLILYNVCIVGVCGFQLIFHSAMQLELELCLNYYER